MHDNKGAGFNAHSGSTTSLWLSMATSKRKSLMVLLAAVSVLFLLYQRQHFVNPMPVSRGGDHTRKVGGLLGDINNSTLGVSILSYILYWLFSQYFKNNFANG